MADFTGIVSSLTIAYSFDADEITITDTTSYAGQGFTRTDADVLIFASYKKSSGEEERITLIPDNIDPTLVSSWVDDIEGDSDGWYHYKIVYAFDFAATGGTHQEGDIVRSGGIYYIYTSTTSSSVAVTDSTKWQVLSVDNYNLAKIDISTQILITRNSEKCLLDLRLEFIKGTCSKDEGIVFKECLFLGAKELFSKNREAEAQELVEILNGLCND